MRSTRFAFVTRTLDSGLEQGTHTHTHTHTGTHRWVLIVALSTERTAHPVQCCMLYANAQAMAPSTTFIGESTAD